MPLWGWYEELIPTSSAETQRQGKSQRAIALFVGQAQEIQPQGHQGCSLQCCPKQAAPQAPPPLNPACPRDRPVSHADF